MRFSVLEAVMSPVADVLRAVSVERSNCQVSVELRHGSKLQALVPEKACLSVARLLGLVLEVVHVGVEGIVQDGPDDVASIYWEWKR